MAKSQYVLWGFLLVASSSLCAMQALNLDLVPNLFEVQNGCPISNVQSFHQIFTRSGQISLFGQILDVNKMDRQERRRVLRQNLAEMRRGARAWLRLQEERRDNGSISREEFGTLKKGVESEFERLDQQERDIDNWVDSSGPMLLQVIVLEGAGLVSPSERIIRPTWSGVFKCEGGAYHVEIPMKDVFKPSMYTVFITPMEPDRFKGHTFFYGSDTARLIVLPAPGDVKSLRGKD